MPRRWMLKKCPMKDPAVTDTPFDLSADPRFAAIQDVFIEHFENGEEHGAAFCVYRHGDLIADFKGGWADRKKTKPFTETTLASVFSSGKAVAALVIAYLADEDRFNYDTPIKILWPEFDRYGKGDLTIAQIMSHQSGLSGITNPHFKGDDWYNWGVTCGELAAQKPIFAPGSASGYSPITYGFLAGEIARRADEYGRTLGTILRQDICAPQNLDIWIGLPESEHHRCADMQKPRQLADLGEITPATRAAFMEPWSTPRGRSLSDWRSAELAGSNCHATAKSLAQLMQMAIDGTVNGERFLAEDIVTSLREPRISGPDQVLPFEVSYAAGLLRNAPNHFYGPLDQTVGHSGWGGSCVFADPVTGLTGAYVMTRQGNSLIGDPRPVRLINAVYDAMS